MTQRLVSFVFGIVVLATIAYVYLGSIYMLGFPDGHITEIESAERFLAYVYIAIAVPTTFYFLDLAIFSSAANIRRKTLFGIVFISALAFCLMMIDSFLQGRLSGGTLA